MTERNFKKRSKTINLVFESHNGKFYYLYRSAPGCRHSQTLLIGIDDADTICCINQSPNIRVYCSGQPDYSIQERQSFFETQICERGNLTLLKDNILFGEVKQTTFQCRRLSCCCEGCLDDDFFVMDHALKPAVVLRQKGSVSWFCCYGNIKYDIFCGINSQYIGKIRRDNECSICSSRVNTFYIDLKTDITKDQTMLKYLFAGLIYIGRI